MTVGAEFARPPYNHAYTVLRGKFDAWLMGEKVYQRPFEVVLTTPDRLPPESEPSAPLGRHWNGARIGFDLGASADLDIGTSDMLDSLSSDMRQDGIDLLFSQVRSSVRDRMRLTGLLEFIGEDHIYMTVDAAVQAFEALLATDRRVARRWT